MPPKKPELPAGFSANPQPYNFSPENGVTLSLGMLGTGVVSLVLGLIAILTFGFSWSTKIDRMSEQIDSLTKTVWTVSDAREMVHRARRDNPTLTLPDPADIHRSIHERQ